MTEIILKTERRVEFVDITQRIQSLIEKTGVKEGVCHLFVPHTTAGITINENADPSVVRDIIDGLERVVPDSVSYHHLEGNSPAHIKASLLGSSQVVFFHEGRLRLGTWQGIYFCEFDGPRHRRVWVEIQGE